MKVNMFKDSNFFFQLIKFRAYPSCHMAREAGFTLNGRQSLAGLTQGDRHPFTLKSHFRVTS